MSFYSTTPLLHYSMYVAYIDEYNDKVSFIR